MRMTVCVCVCVCVWEVEERAQLLLLPGVVQIAMLPQPRLVIRVGCALLLTEQADAATAGTRERFEHAPVHLDCPFARLSVPLDAPKYLLHKTQM